MVVAGPSFRQAQVEDVSRLRARTSSKWPLEERALWEAAIQLDVVAVNTAEAQVARGGTVAAWLAGQKPAAGGDRKGRPHTSFDRALLLTFAVFNLLALVALGTAIDWAVRHLV